MSKPNAKKTVEMRRFEKATLRLHCMWCGDTMFVMSAGKYVCVGCNVRQEVVVRFGEDIFVEFEDEILPEEIHITQHVACVDANLLNEVAQVFKR